MSKPGAMSGDDLKGAFPCHHSEVPDIERGYPAAIALSARNHRGIRQTERQIRVSDHQFPDSEPVPLSAIHGIGSLDDVIEEGRQNSRSVIPLYEIADLGQSRGRQDELPGFGIDDGDSARMIGVARVQDRYND